MKTHVNDVIPFSLAVRYLFMTNNGSGTPSKLVVEPFNAAHEQNDYEVRPFPTSCPRLPVIPPSRFGA